MRLYFDKDVYGWFDDNANGTTTAEKLAYHFSVYERDVVLRNKVDKVVGANYATIGGELRHDVIDVDLKDLVVWDTNNEMDYILEIENFTDRNNNRMFRDYAEFKFGGYASFYIVNDGIKVIPRKYETEIRIQLNTAVDRGIAEDPTNYIFTAKNGARYDVAELGGEIFTEINGKKYSISSSRL